MTGLYLIYLMLKMVSLDNYSEETLQLKIGWAMGFFLGVIWAICLIDILFDAFVLIRSLFTAKKKDEKPASDTSLKSNEFQVVELMPGESSASPQQNKIEVFNLDAPNPDDAQVNAEDVNVYANNDYNRAQTYYQNQPQSNYNQSPSLVPAIQQIQPNSQYHGSRMSNGMLVSDYRGGDYISEEQEEASYLSQDDRPSQGFSPSTPIGQTRGSSNPILSSLGNE